MRLRDYIRNELVIPDLSAGGLEETLDALVQRLHDRAVIGDPDGLKTALLAREAVHTTALGHGVALPHATLADLTEPVILVAVAPEGTRFGPTGLDPVRVLFLLLSPVDHAADHIKLLARICRLVRHPGFIDRLPDLDSVDALVDEIARVDGAHV